MDSEEEIDENIEDFDNNDDFNEENIDYESEESEEEYVEENKKNYPVKQEINKIKKNAFIDDDEFLKDAIAQIEKMEKASQNLMTIEKSGLNMTTEGLGKIVNNVDVSQIVNIYQCHWCSKYYNFEQIISDNTGNVCKHCYFGVNYDLNSRLAFDTECYKKGLGIALYIIECKDSHNTETCTRKPECYLCDFILKKPIKNILNYEMLGVDKNNCSNNSNDSDDAENIEFNCDFDSSKNIKIPSKLTI